jgi:hypothetical protein
LPEGIFGGGDKSVLFGDFAQQYTGFWNGTFSAWVVEVRYRIFIIRSLDEFYGGIGFFKRQYPGRKTHRTTPHIDKLNILSI